MTLANLGVFTKLMATNTAICMGKCLTFQSNFLVSSESRELRKGFAPETAQAAPEILPNNLEKYTNSALLDVGTLMDVWIT